jgi:signal transduction histidine kinase
LRWTAVALAIATVSRLDYVLWPDLWIGDILQLAAYGALLWGSLSEIDRYQRRAAQQAVFDERRRMARDLHDGLAAELAYIAMESRRLAQDGSQRRRAGDEVVAAAERALEESRLAISALTRPADEPLDRALHHTLESAADRMGVEVVLDLEPGVNATPVVREALLRVALEALRNAARHGRANEVTVELRARGDGLEMTIADDGRGFDAAAPARPDALGLVAMRERVEVLGGSLHIVAALGEGTRVEVALP